IAAAENAEVVVISTKLESELAELALNERIHLFSGRQSMPRKRSKENKI
ncbi:hypothetical protein RDn1_330, partial [Candidatus Termititenax dinenymphae]